MISIVGQFPDAEDDYRRTRLTRSFRNHRARGPRSLLHRRSRTVAPATIDWYGG